MPNIKKVPANAGAQWLVDAFALLRKHALGLCGLGLSWGVLSVVPVLVGGVVGGSAALLLQLALTVLGPFLLGGLIWAVREADQGRSVQPSQLWQGLKLGRNGSILATLLPQIGVGLVLAVLLLGLVGVDQLKQLVDVANKLQEVQQNGGQPDPVMFDGLPLGALFLCLLATVVLGIVASLLNFVALPQILFSATPAFAAMATSLKASLRNLPALIVLFLLTLVTMFVVMTLVTLVAGLAGLALGAVAYEVVSNLLLLSVLMPLFAAVSYFAWKDLVAASAAASTVPPPLPDTIEA